MNQGSAVMQRESNSAANDGMEWLTIDQLCEKFPWLTKNSIYYLSHQQRIPHFKIRGRLLFRLNEILKWIEEQRVCQ
jgi:Helix-turn-helix domain